jgi:hypothetical protein
MKGHMALSRAEQKKAEKATDKQKLEAFMARRKKNRAKEMASLRSERLKLNKLSPKDIGK